ncbi:MAG TPA: SBBP repeat-containing protein [Polyangiaceae bacterium]|nr:SBBP repeat-containing protein [Polyangiaceae bacterium]
MFDATGTLRSAFRWGGADDDELSGMTVDPSGNVLIVGTTFAGSTQSFFVTKLRP